MLVEGVRVPVVPVVRTDTSGDGVGGGGGGGSSGSRSSTVRATTAIIDLCLMLLLRAARTTAGSKGLPDVACQSCVAGAGSSVLHPPPHDQASSSSGPRPRSHSA